MSDLLPAEQANETGNEKPVPPLPRRVREGASERVRLRHLPARRRGLMLPVAPRAGPGFPLCRTVFTRQHHGNTRLAAPPPPAGCPS